MPSTHKEHRLILASQSPRRKYLLQKAGLVFQVIPSSFDESGVPLTEPGAYVKTLARAKAEDVASRHPDAWVIGADTIVLIGSDILGKPGSKREAGEMLRHLSGQTHQVYTGYALCCRAMGRMITDAVKTDVRFKTLSEAEIEWYVQTGEPFDKAGAYAIQGMGTFLVRRINGSYTNVVGLPVCEVIEVLLKKGVVKMDAENGNGKGFVL